MEACGFLLLMLVELVTFVEPVMFADWMAPVPKRLFSCVVKATRLGMSPSRVAVNDTAEAGIAEKLALVTPDKVISVISSV